MNSLLWDYCCYQEAQTERRQRGRKRGAGGVKAWKVRGGGDGKKRAKRGNGEEGGGGGRGGESEIAREGRGRPSRRETGINDVVRGDGGYFKSVIGRRPLRTPPG